MFLNWLYNSVLAHLFSYMLIRFSFIHHNTFLVVLYQFCATQNTQELLSGSWPIRKISYFKQGSKHKRMNFQICRYQPLKLATDKPLQKAMLSPSTWPMKSCVDRPIWKRLKCGNGSVLPTAKSCHHLVPGYSHCWASCHTTKIPLNVPRLT